MAMEPVYSVVVPLYNEQEVIGEAYRRLTEVMEKTGEAYELVFVNDGSRDDTLALARGLRQKDERVKLLSFSRNFGHQIAITAGMDYARGQAIVVIDADLQDPPEVILPMIEKWKEGYAVVYGLRAVRKGETAFKKLTASVFYRFLRRMTEVDVPADVGDFRLIDRKVCRALQSLPERNRYVRGLVSWVGFKQTGVSYTREERFAGETKYPLKKMLKLAGDAIASFSYKPLKWPVFLGAFLMVGSGVYLLALLIRVLTAGVLQGEALLMMGLVLFFLGAALALMGAVGGYIGRICDEVKGRPLYILEDVEGLEKQN
ncbi:MAG: glycosyltransferase family 2 protein [Oscillospiraceae bacterium]|nr:glycosyltransferase family 2 protein [Oscillospiraceae bacterium]